MMESGSAGCHVDCRALPPSFFFSSSSSFSGKQNPSHAKAAKIPNNRVKIRPSPANPRVVPSPVRGHEDDRYDCLHLRR
jgi:hypothetical protein